MRLDQYLLAVEITAHAVRACFGRSPHWKVEAVIEYVEFSLSGEGNFAIVLDRLAENFHSVHAGFEVRPHLRRV